MPMTHDRALDILILAAGTQKRLAAILGMSPEHISRWRHGARNVPKWVVRLAEFIEMTPPKNWPAAWSD